MSDVIDGCKSLTASCPSGLKSTHAVQVWIGMLTKHTCGLAVGSVTYGA